MERIAITVIMPSLNVATYVEESVRSVLSQTLHNIEVLCIDAGSSDGTLEILQRFTQSDERVRLINSDRKSYGYQVNIGIQQARGEYLAIVETDDYVDAGMFEQLYQVAEKEFAEIVKSDYYAYRTQQDGARFFVKRMLHLDSELYGRVFNPNEEGNAACDDWFLWNGIYRTDFIRANNITLSETDGAAFQDIGFLHRTNSVATRVVYLRDCFYRYCLDRDGSSSNSGKGLLYSYQEFERLLLELEDMSFSQKQACYTRMAKSFYCCMMGIRDFSIFNNSEYVEKYKWFQLNLSESIKKGLVTKDSFVNGMWDALQNLLVSLENFKAKREQENERLKTYLLGKRVVIFGCGNYGMEALDILKENLIEVECFMDNNSILWGMWINGKEICKPKDVKKMKDRYYLVANENYWKEIREQLLSMGCDEDRILIYKQM